MSLKKAVPPSVYPTCSDIADPREDWERQIDSFDRSVRRSNRRFRLMVVRIDHKSVGLITSERKLPLSRLNELRPFNESIRIPSLVPECV